MDFEKLGRLLAQNEYFIEKLAGLNITWGRAAKYGIPVAGAAYLGSLGDDAVEDMRLGRKVRKSQGR